MMKSALLAGALGLALLSTAQAQNATCTNENMMMMQQQMDKMNDASMKAQKDMATQEMMAAKTDMQNNRLDSCAAHMGNAMKEMNMDSSMMMKKG